MNGQCGGCSSGADCHDYSYAASCTGIPSGNYGTCSAAKMKEGKCGNKKKDGKCGEGKCGANKKKMMETMNMNNLVDLLAEMTFWMSMMN